MKNPNHIAPNTTNRLKNLALALYLMRAAPDAGDYEYAERNARCEVENTRARTFTEREARNAIRRMLNSQNGDQHIEAEERADATLDWLASMHRDCLPAAYFSDDDQQDDE
jgi:hypothetical protein